MVFIGIDPGQQGAIAFICSRGKKQAGFIDMPLLPEKGIDTEKLYETLDSTIKNYGKCYVLLEKAQALPGQGSVSMFHYGVGYGKILAALEILGIPFEEIRPNKWKTEFGLSGSGKKKDGKGKMTTQEKNAARRERKEIAVKTAMQMFPQFKNDLITSKGKILDGRAEALLIAEYGVRRIKGEK